MAGVTDFLFNGSPPPAVTTTSSSTTSLPQWWQDYAQGILSKANQLAATPYTPYPGPRQAPFSADQAQSFDLTKQNVGSYKPYYQAGQGALQQAATPFNQSTFNQFLSPYIGGVVDRIAQLGGRNLAENLLPAVNETFIGSGQFGGSRNAEFTRRALRDTNESILGQQAYALQGAQDAAMQGYNTAMNRTGQAGQALGTLGTAAQQAGIMDAAALNAAGQQQQQQTQGSLDLAYQDFLNQQNWPFNMLNFMKGSLSGINAPTSTTSVGQAPLAGSQYGSSPLATLGGALSLGNQLGSFLNGGASNLFNGIGSAVGSGIGALGSAANSIGNFIGNLFAYGGSARSHPRRRHYADGGMDRRAVNRGVLADWAAQRARSFAPRMGTPVGALGVARFAPMPVQTRMPALTYARPMMAVR